MAANRAYLTPAQSALLHQLEREDPLGTKVVGWDADRNRLFVRKANGRAYVIIPQGRRYRHNALDHASSVDV